MKERVVVYVSNQMYCLLSRRRRGHGTPGGPRHVSNTLAVLSNYLVTLQSFDHIFFQLYQFTRSTPQLQYSLRIPGGPRSSTRPSI
jgi:hypothetical protein